MVMMDKFDARQVLQAVQRHRVTHLHLVPTMMVRMMELPAAERRSYDLSSLKCLAHAAAPCPPDIKRAMIEWLGPIIDEYYGGSEGIGLCFVKSREWLERPRTVGKAVYGTLHILDDQHQELQPGEVGTIYFGGTPPFAYHNDPEKTRTAFNKQGYATCGDFGRVDGEGHLDIEDRRTDLILSSGVNIYPSETEEALLGHRAVGDVAVVGVPSPESGHDVLAVVELRAGFEASPQLAAELIDYCRSRIAHFKCPRRVEFQRLPRTPTGKLLRRDLRQQYSVSLATPEPRPEAVPSRMTDHAYIFDHARSPRGKGAPTARCTRSRR
jgi:acyl-CoA synthetase (AMP-forming)/AMP-acid ligase II